MSLMTAQRMMLEAVDPTTALGAPGVRTTICDTPVTVRRDDAGHVVVTDDRGACHDFWGVTWEEIERSMTDYFGTVGGL